MADENTESKENKKEYLNDQWTNAVDVLGREHFTKTIRDLILRVDPPFALSVNGRWGTGKTSILHALMTSLGGEPLHYVNSMNEKEEESGESNELPDTLKLTGDINEKKEKGELLTVWFNPWQYQHEENPLISLLHEIQEHIKYEAKAWEDAKETLKSGLKATIYSLGDLADSAPSLLPGGGKLKFFGGITKRMEEYSTQRYKDEFQQKTDAQRFVLQFEQAIKQTVGENGKLVIFIDDLDRCHDEAVFKLLESIKLYLSSRNCVFIFGLDAGHVETAISRVTEYSYQESVRYVDKLFQVRLDLPEPDEKQIERFINEQWKLIFSDNQKLSVNNIPLLCEHLPTNPRFIKNFLNGLIFYSELWTVLNPEKDFNPQQFLLVQLFRAFYPDAYELLKQDIKHIKNINALALNSADIQSELQHYLYTIFENPVYDETALSTAFDTQMPKERFQQIKTSVPHAKAKNSLLTSFCSAFEADIDSLRSYLL